MKASFHKRNFYCPGTQLFAVLFSVFGFSGIAQADCKGGVGTEDIVISNKPTDFYVDGDIVDCVTTGSITLGPYVTLPYGAVFNLIAPRCTRPHTGLQGKTPYETLKQKAS